MPFQKIKFSRVWRLFRKKSGPTRPTDRSYTTETSIKAFLESLSLIKRSAGRTQLENAISHGRTTLLQLPAETPLRAVVLNTLASLFTDLHSQNFDIDTLNSAIEYGQEAVDLTPAGNPNRAGYLNNLSNRLSTRYGREGNLADLAQAIEHSQEAVDLTPVGNPHRASHLNNLSNHLSTRYEREGDPTDITQAIEQSENAINCLNSPPSIRVRGCVNAMNYLAQVQRWPKARTLLDRGLEILPLLISNLSSKLDQENMMKSVSGLAAIGCAVSLDCNDDGFEAVRILELTRGTINRLAINSAAEISALSRLPPSLAKQYEELSALINRPVKGEDDQSRTSLSREAAVSKLHDLIELIRRETEFSDFPNLLPKTELLETSSDQVIVILNTTEFRTDALLIRSNDMVQVLPLSKSAFRSSNEYYDGLCGRFGFNQHQTLLAWVEANEETRRDLTWKAWVQANEEMRQFLTWLWDQVVDPILRALGFEPSHILSRSVVPNIQNNTAGVAPYRPMKRSKGLDSEALAEYLKLMKQQAATTSSLDNFRPMRNRGITPIKTDISRFQRIHWIGVGCMSAFPFHAAGYGLQDPRRNTMSCAISSYASTLTTRIFAKKKPLLLNPKSSTLLLVAMPKTPGEKKPGELDLPGVDDEVQVIQSTLQGRTTIKLHKSVPPNVDAVVRDLPNFDCVHFACHGSVDPRSPFRSGLLLCGNEPEKDFNENTRDSKLTVEIVSSINTRHSQLAFLSACCTAENASPVLMDEGIHLAGGFQLAGYPHVIASLWEANDALSVAVTDKFYHILFTESKIAGHDRIAYALHDAVLAARQICEDPLSWATTIHFGP